LTFAKGLRCDALVSPILRENAAEFLPIAGHGRTPPLAMKFAGLGAPLRQ
jgi:hypothetical protein